MKKVKIAISLDRSLFDLIDSKVDGNTIRSRSQAIELFLRKGIEEHSIDTAVLLLHKNHQLLAAKQVKGRSLIKNQLDFFERNGIRSVYIVTQHSKNINILLKEVMGAKIHVQIFEREAGGNATALRAISEHLPENFVVMSGDTYNDFNLSNMVRKHLESSTVSTMGLMSRDRPSKYGAAILDGDKIIDFEEKPKHAKSHVVNAGIYIFRKEVFELFETSTISLERDLFPKIARIGQLTGFFTHGEYVHVAE